ncbi:hypothetical protein EVAR_94600_1 [Eumeta japonica]|uniref:Uncharacterized protein n=1 Tax=Eumeta variegata TaxID=151549 RepID=A0A4C1UU61_EUMVA|nr:hypothetical protein EVAR_94600_1 [Eumeta japonica]
MSALVGTIENHPESTSESDTGSFTLTRQQRPQPQAVGSRRRPRAIQDPEKHLKNQGKLRAEMSRMNEAIDNPVRMNERIEAERMSEMSPKIRQIRQPVKASHPRQSSSDSNVSKTPEFFAPPPPNRSPLSPNTEESLMSDEDDRSIDYLKKNDKPESSKCLAPDCQYEAPREQKEELKTNHLHCYSDTNTMDSGWQSGSEKHITD